ncbi:AAA family ATPase, partial [Flavobacteriaceae bacterium]|nr:AAA family ATPase [Flavobacteriaceae bacterium]
MINNSNTNKQKRRNKHVKLLRDSSNNNQFPSNNELKLTIRNNNTLHTSNNNKMLYLFDDSNIIYNKNNINPNLNANIMNNSSKLITYLDNNNNNNDNNIKYTKNDDLLLKILLKQSEEDFYKHFNSQFFSGFPVDLQPIENTLSPIKEDVIIKEQITINTPVNNLKDLIDLCDKYPLHDNIEYNINMKSLHNIRPSLLELQNMIGMNSIKENIVDQILYFVQDLHNVSPNNSDYMHAVICGPPGTGKTEVAKIMGKIFSNLGILTKNIFKKVTRDDLVAGYLGQTAIKTKDVIKECLGGVLFIDEAYALGNSEKRDSFSKECIDTLCEALSDNK